VIALPLPRARWDLKGPVQLDQLSHFSGRNLMTRATKYTLCILGLILCIGLLLKGSVPQVLSGMWDSAGSMTEPRSGASAVLLKDGRILITGGEGASGALISVELYGNTGSFSPAPPMDVARSRHISIVLQDGRVL